MKYLLHSGAVIALILFTSFFLAAPASAQGTGSCSCGFNPTYGQCMPFGFGQGNNCTTGSSPVCSTSGTTCSCTCVDDNEQSTPVKEYNICDPIKDPDEKADCIGCLGTDGTNPGIWTAIGCIHTDPSAFTTSLMNFAIGIAGGLALLLMVYGAFLVTTSTGDPKKADEGKEIITGTIAGLLFIIFSVALLKLIGVDILNIPGF